MKNKSFSLLLFIILMSTCIAFSLISFADENANNNVNDSAEKKQKPDDDKVNPLENVDINIIKRDSRTIETHSINGVVYKVKIIPSSGPVYYLYDTDGDGSLETRSNREISETTVQQWKIFQW